MISIEDKEKCQGCEACVSVCPQNCISMITDDDGFRYPEVDVKQCINCGLCEKKCPDMNMLRKVLNRKAKDIRVIKCYAKDDEIRMSSSSGGIFSILAENIIRQGGCAFGVRKISTTELEFTCVEKLEDIPQLRGSKYFQAHIKEAYSEVKSKLKAGQKVLFVGTPCQIAALYSVVGVTHDNLITCDLKCHGVPSPESFFKFCTSIEKHTGNKVRDYYRDKSMGWNPVVFTTVLDNGKTISKEAYDDEFNIAFITSMNLRPSCYNCRFAYIPRIGDITLSDNFIDAHTASKEDKFKGLSIISLNSRKGTEAFARIRDQLEYSEHTLKGRMLFGWLSGCKTYSSFRDEFMSRYQNQDFLDLIHELRNRPENRIQKVQRFLKKLKSECNKYFQRYTHYC